MIIKKTGFSVIECMIYCLVMALVMIVWFNGIVIFNRLCTQQTKEINTISSVYSTFDVFVRDLRKAPHDSNLWPLITNTAFIFKYDGSLYIGWEYANNTLMRYQGIYDCHTKKWLKKTKSLILTMMQDCSFSSDCLHTHIKTMTCMVKIHDKTYQRSAYIHKGYI